MATDERRALSLDARHATAEPLSADELASLTASPETNVVMTGHDGQKYLCSLPPPVPEGENAEEDDAGDSAASSSADEKEKDGDESGGAPVRKTSRGGAKPSAERDGKVVSEILEPLSTACFYRIEGWWTYEFCHKKKVRQYHQEGDTITNEYSLGEYDAKATSELHALQGHFTEAPGVTGSNERFHAHVFTGGTACDLTDLERQTEVRFVCAPAGGVNAITAIKEPATCKYTFTFATPLLCNHRSFKVHEKPVSRVKCRAFAEVGSEAGGASSAGEEVQEGEGDKEGGKNAGAGGSDGEL